MDTKKLRQKILDLAIRGKLVPQDPNDEPASVLLERIKAEKERLIKEGKIKRSKKTAKTSDTPHYENVPFEVPKGWVWTTLPELCTIPITDGTHKTPTYTDKEHGVPFISSKDVTSQRINWNNIKYITRELHEELHKRIAPQKNDILLAKNGTTGVAAIVEDTRVFDIYVTLAVIRPSQNICPQYLYQVINSNFCKEQFNSRLTGIGLPNLHLVDIKKTMIPLPPISEQKRIVTEIERWFVWIEQIRQSKTDLQDVIKQTKSKILDLAIHGKLVPQDPSDEPASELLKRINPKAEITCDNGHYGKIPQRWALVKLGDLFDAISAKRVLKSEWKTKGVPFYRAREIAKLSECNEVVNELFIANEHYNELKKKYGVPEPGDIMLSAVGTIGKSYIVKNTDKFYYKDASVLCLRNYNKLNPIYFSMLFSSSFLQNQMNEYSKGTTVDTITLERLKSYIIPLPPLEEQKRIVGKIAELFFVLDNILNALEA